MRIAYFDTIGGISGDMILGAFVSAGVPLDTLRGEMQKLNIRGIEIDARHVERGGITAIKLDVTVSEKQHQHRNLRAITDIIENSSLTSKVKDRAKKIFHELAQAEANVHNTSVDSVHFHEVGSLDAIVDIVGTSICLDLINAERVYSSPIKLGSGGLIETEHGKMPIPAPATLEILKGYPALLTDIPHELTTPTGAAIIKAVSSGVLTAEKITVESIGYGAGSRVLDTVPNMLRVVIGELPQMYDQDEMVIVETNIDNMNPEIYPYLIEKLLNSGAQDAYAVPIVMKKGRPGILFSALASRIHVDDVVGIIFRETTTLGVRIQHVERKKLLRTKREVKTSLGVVKVKIISLDGKERIIPEFEECKKLALEKGMPLVEIYRILEKELSS